MALAFFWVCSGMLLLGYVLYPASLLFLGWLRRRKEIPALRTWPDVSVLVSARNEEKHIGARIDNLLASEYPGKIEILAGSDASEDSTDSIVLGRAAEGVRLIRSDVRIGKPRMLQRLASEASGAVFVFTDCDTIFRRDTIRELVAPFADPRIGCTDGSKLNSLQGETCESVYWRYECLVRSLCSRLGALLGATGAVFALRREAFRPLAADRSDDFELGVMARILGYSAVYNPMAVAMEPAPDDTRQYSRMIRIVSWMSISGFKLFWRSLAAGRPGIAVQILVHKMIRWITGYLLVAVTAAAAFLWHSPPYRAAFLALSAFHLLAAAGYLSRGRLPGKLLFPYYFWLMNGASMIGLARALAGRPVEKWDRAPRKKAEA